MSETSTSQMKKVLLIAYYFPPDFAVGGQRIAKFARNLPAFGWEPTVLTVEDRYREQIDKERLNDIGNTRVLKTVKTPKITDLLLFIKRTASAVFRSTKPGESVDNVDEYGDDFGQTQSETLLQKLKRYYVTFSCFPDNERSWVIPATLRTLIEIKRKRFDCIMTTSPPHSSHLVGLVVKKITGITWFADFRDPWIDLLHYRAPRIRNGLSENIERWIENQVIRNADRVITTTDDHRDALVSRFGSETPRKFISIPNGIDFEKYQNIDSCDKYATFTICYTGTIYLKRSPEPLFMAIHKLISSGKITASQINVKLFGNCEKIDGKPIVPIIKSYGLESVVDVSGPIPLSDTFSIMQRSHLLLLLVTPVQKMNIPAKIYDYFGSGTKILVLSEQGATSNLIEKTHSGSWFPPNDIDGIAEYLLTLVTNEDADLLRNDPTTYSRFDIKVLTKELARLLSLSAEDVGCGKYAVADSDLSSS